MTVTHRLIRRPEVERLTGLKRSVIYDLIQRGRFPKPVHLTDRAVAWPESEVLDWIGNRPRAGGCASVPATEPATR